MDLPSGCEKERSLEQERWQQIKSLFLEADQLPQAERGRFLEQACAGDAALRQEIEAMLYPQSAALSALGDPLIDLGSRDDELLAEGTILDGYRIERKLGQGGTGVVYLAIKEENQLRVPVAVKVLKRGRDTEEILARFGKEQQILAYLDHPTITRFLSGGVTIDGRPYLVMEYVSGLPIDVYCRRHQLSVRQRLTLFRKVCRAVHFAHQRLIVHRDLKPSNILVNPDGEPKLLDFGIAKILVSDGDQLTQTQEQQRALTPAYASPEQVLGQPTTTATDTYSLGVLLYVLLTGQRPYLVKHQNSGDFKRQICDITPAKPSSVFHRHLAKKGQHDEFSNGLTNPFHEQAADQLAKLARTLSGDLDAIVMKALRKGPQDRYESVGQLGEDIDRYLGGFSVLAGKDTFSYHAVKFIRRHRLALSAATVGLVLLVMLGSTFWVQQKQLAMQRHQADSERRHAQEIVAFAQGMFRMADPYEADGREYTARDLLDQGVHQIRWQLQEQPAARALVLTTMGMSYSTLGDWKQGMALIEEAHALKRKVYGDEHSEVAHSLLLVGSKLLEGRRTEQAEVTLIEALEMAQRTFPPNDPELAGYFGELGNCYRALQRFDEAESYHRQAIDILEKRPDSQPDMPLANQLHDLARLKSDRGDYGEAVDLYQRSLAIKRHLLEPNHPGLANSLNNLALVLRRLGQHDQALIAYDEALALTELAFGEDHPKTIVTLENMASLYFYSGQLDESEVALRKALAIHDRLGNRSGKKLYTAYNILGNIYFRRKNYQAAETYMKQSLAAVNTDEAQHGFAYMVGLTNLAGLYRDTSRFQEAEPLFEEALAIARERFGPKHPYVAKILASQARLFEQGGRDQFALSNLVEVLAIREAAFSLEHPEYIKALQQSVTLAGANRQFQTALALQRRTRELIDCLNGTVEPQLMTVLEEVSSYASRSLVAARD